MHFVTCPKQGLEMEAVVLHRVGFLEYFCPKQVLDFKPSAVPLTLYSPGPIKGFKPAPNIRNACISQLNLYSHELFSVRKSFRERPIFEIDEQEMSQ